MEGNVDQKLLRHIISLEPNRTVLTLGSGDFLFMRYGQDKPLIDGVAGIYINLFSFPLHPLRISNGVALMVFIISQVVTVVILYKEWGLRGNYK